MKTLNSPQYMINANEDPLLSIEQENVYMILYVYFLPIDCLGVLLYDTRYSRKSEPIF